LFVDKSADPVRNWGRFLSILPLSMMHSGAKRLRLNVVPVELRTPPWPVARPLSSSSIARARPQNLCVKEVTQGRQLSQVTAACSSEHPKVLL